MAHRDKEWAGFLWFDFSIKENCCQIQIGPKQLFLIWWKLLLEKPKYLLIHSFTLQFCSFFKWRKWEESKIGTLLTPIDTLFMKEYEMVIISTRPYSSKEGIEASLNLQNVDFSVIHKRWCKSIMLIKHSQHSDISNFATWYLGSCVKSIQHFLVSSVIGCGIAPTLEIKTKPFRFQRKIYKI